MVAFVLASTNAVQAQLKRPSKYKEGVHFKRAPKLIGRQDKTNLGKQDVNNAPVTDDQRRGADGDRPIIACDEPVHDFGTVWRGPALKHNFTIRNNGVSVLKIKRVKPSCGCTVTQGYPKELRPGETGQFGFKLQSAKLHGKFEKSITITSNDPARPTFRVRLRGTVKQYVEMTPNNVQFGKLYGDEPVERIIKLTNNTEDQLKLEIVSKPQGNFDVDLIETTPGQAYELRVTAKPPFKPGQINQRIQLETNIEKQKSFIVLVRGTVPERIDVSPTLLTIRPPSANAPRPLTRIVRITNYGPEPTTILEALIDDPDITVRVNEQRAGKAYTIQLQIPPGHIIPPAGRTLVIKTSDPVKPTITIPVKAFRTRTAATRKRQLRPAQTLVGQVVPSFVATTTSGETFSSSGFIGRVSVLDFFAVNCGFCSKQIPRLEKIRQEYEPKGVRFVAISQTMRNRKYSEQEAKDKISSLGFKGELIVDPDNEIGTLFRATSYPTMVILGRRARIDAVNIGNLADLEKRLKMQLDALLDSRPVPQFAKAVPKAKPAPARKRATDLIGKKAPAFAITTFDGKAVSNSTFAEHPATVLNFVAGNCGYCKKQIPRLEKLRAGYEAKGVRFVNMVQTMRTRFTKDQVIDKMKGLGSHMEIAHDVDNQIGPLFGATGYPTMVVVGKSGKIEAVNVGNISDLEKRLGGQLDALIAGKAVPKLAAAPRKPTPQRKRPQDLIGKPAPAFTMSNFDGKTVSSADFAKHPATVLNFVATNCGYCKKQIPRLEKLRKSYEQKGVRFVNMVQTMRTPSTKDQVIDKMKGLGSHMEIVHDVKNSIGPLYGATGYPTMVVVGRSGKIEAVNVGNIGDLETRLKGQLDALIAGKTVPKLAAAKKPAARKRPTDLIGKSAPTFTSTTFDGKPFENADFANHPATVINIVAGNCGYCSKQIPRLEKLRETFETKGVRFVNLVQTMRTPFTKEKVIEKMKSLGSHLEVVHDPKNEIGGLFNASGFPTMVVVGKTGKIEAVNVGNISDLEKRVTDQLTALIEGKPIPKSAMAQRKSGGGQRPAMQMQGKPSPAFTLSTLDGKSLGNDDFKNHPATILNFVAPNCGFCKRQLPNVEKVRKEYESKGVRFVNVVQKMRKNFTEQEIIGVFEKVGSKLEVTTGDFANNSVGKQFKVTSFPTMFVVDRNGKVAHVTVGAKKNLETTLKSQLDALIKG